MKQSVRSISVFYAALLLISFFATPGAWAAFEEDNEGAEVECMRVDRWGDDYQLEDIGHVTVYGNQQAAQNCNQSFYACRSSCVACVYDYQYGSDVCEYPNGNRFLK
jgi:hypothetical protein